MLIQKLQRSFLVLSLLLGSLFLLGPTSSASVPQVTLLTCTNPASGVQIAIKANHKRCKEGQLPAIWHIASTDTALPTGAGIATLKVCTSKNDSFTYQYLWEICPRYQVSTTYTRKIGASTTPTIASSKATGFDSASLTLAPESSTDSPVAYYLVKNNKTGITIQVPWVDGRSINIPDLQPLTSYSFTITAVSIDGTSTTLSSSTAITTTARPVEAPFFSLTHSSETVSAGITAVGFSIASIGGAIASFSISPALPAGMLFNTATGALSGTPTTATAVTIYTVTATNASGSTSQSFTLTVSAPAYTAPTTFSIGDVGPGGGTVFYYSATAFAESGAACASNCHYLEWAPNTWSGVSSDPQMQWSSDRSHQAQADYNLAGDGSGNEALGAGFRNTTAMLTSNSTYAYTGDTSGAAYAVHSYAGSDNSAGQWFLPSFKELEIMFNSSFYSSGRFTGQYYWSSSGAYLSANNGAPYGGAFMEGIGSPHYQGYANTDSFLGVRPVRVF